MLKYSTEFNNEDNVISLVRVNLLYIDSVYVDLTAGIGSLTNTTINTNVKRIQLGVSGVDTQLHVYILTMSMTLRCRYSK